MPKIVPKNNETLLFCEKCNTNSTKIHFYRGAKLIKIFESLSINCVSEKKNLIFV